MKWSLPSHFCLIMWRFSGGTSVVTMLASLLGLAAGCVFACA